MTQSSPCPVLRAPLAEVTTERLALRRFRSDDTELLAPVFSKYEFWQFPYGRGFTHAETQAFVTSQIAEWNSYNLGSWVAIERGSGTPVGYVGISIPHFLPEILPAVEVGWRFDPDFWGKGLAREGAAAALDQAFGPLGLDRVCSAPQSENLRSVRVCERLGMTFAKKVEANGNARRGPVEASLYWITREEWTKPLVSS